VLLVVVDARILVDMVMVVGAFIHRLVVVRILVHMVCQVGNTPLLVLSIPSGRLSFKVSCCCCCCRVPIPSLSLCTCLLALLCGAVHYRRQQGVM
jgi:hypothetical protein